MFRSVPPRRRPPVIRARQTTAVISMAVETAVFTWLYSFAPNCRDTTTEQPMLHPKATAMKISVTS